MERYGAWANNHVAQMKPEVKGDWVRYADAQATIAALEETILKMGENAAVVAKDAMAAKEQVAALQGQLTQLDRTLADVYAQRDGLQKDLAQRTAELEVAKGKLDIILRVSRGEPDDELAVDYGGLGWENDPAVLGVYDLIAELKHVKGERDSALESRDWWQAQLDKEQAKLATTATSQPVPPCKEWCRHPEKCAGLASCPQDPTCAD